MSSRRQIAETLAKLTLQHREEDYRHHTYDEDLKQYEYVKAGNMQAVALGKEMFEGPLTGSLSDDPVRNYQYLFVASITLACRFCIEGGMSSEEAFTLSDVYIRQADTCKTVEAVFALHDTMFRDYTLRMQRLLRQNIYSRQVHLCLDYVDRHLQQPLTGAVLAGELGLSPAYLSDLFHKEVGVPLAEYIRRKRIETAQTLLRYTDFTCMEIAEYLCFSSDSHFSRVFRELTGQTPTAYRAQHYRRHFAERQSDAENEQPSSE